MKDLIVKLINENQQRYQQAIASSLQSNNEYQQAYHEGIADEIQNSIWDLEDILTKLEKEINE